MIALESCVGRVVLLLAWMIMGPGAWGYSHAQLGSIIADAELTTIAGGREHLFTDAPVNVVFYFRPGQEYSRMALKELTAVQRSLAGRRVHWVAVVSDRADRSEVQAEIKTAGLAMPVLVDEGDLLYGRLGVSQLPMTAICDQERRLLAYQPFQKVNYTAVVTARVRNLLKEISDDEMAAVLNPPAALTDSNEAASGRRMRLAEILLKAKSYDKALESVDASIEESPSAAAYTLRGEIFTAQGRCSDAIGAFERALRLDPQNTRAMQGKSACEQKN